MTRKEINDKIEYLWAEAERMESLDYDTTALDDEIEMLESMWLTTYRDEAN